MMVLSGNAQKERDESKMLTRDLERNRNQSKMLHAKEKGRNRKKHKTIVFVQCNQLHRAYKFTTMGSFIGLHLPVLIEVLIFMIQYTVVSLQHFKFSLHRFVYKTMITGDEGDKSLFFKDPAVQQQKECSNCRLFAIALPTMHI